MPTERAQQPEQPESWMDDWGEPLPPKVPAAQRFRRGLLFSSGALVVGAAAAAYPWPTAALLLVLAWLLRSGSLAASAAGDRRRLRGRKWYDGVLLLLGAPWDLVRSVPGTVVLALWSAGLALAGALVCYAVAAGVEATLLVSGVVLALCLCLGPGGSRVRSPLARVVNPVSVRGQSWAVALLVVLALAAVLGYRVSTDGTSWVPGDGRPLAGFSLPDHLPLG
jgi:hypothetical protein